MRPRLDWQTWFNEAGLGKVPAGGTHFSQADHAMDAALSGAGAILGRISLAAQALSAGQLVTPFDLAIRSNAQYRIVCPLGAENRPEIAAFREWDNHKAEAIRPHSQGRRIVHISA